MSHLSALPADALCADSGSLTGLTIDEVYRENFHYVWRCMRALGVTGTATDDAVHDVFLVVQRKLPEFDGDAQVTTWLYAIALRVARRYRSRAAKDAARLVTTSGEYALDREMSLASEAAGADAEAALDAQQRLELAREALDGLDDAKREAFVLACVEQLPASEIAHITGIPLNTVYSRIRAARRVFSQRLARLRAARRFP